MENTRDEVLSSSNVFSIELHGGWSAPALAVQMLSYAVRSVTVHLEMSPTFLPCE